MPSNKTLLIWIVATNLFWAGCITTTFYSVGKRNAEIKALQIKDVNQDDFDLLVSNANMIIFRALAAKIQESQDDIELLQHTCVVKSQGQAL